MKCTFALGFLFAFLVLPPVVQADDASSPETIKLTLRSRVETEKDSGRFRLVYKTVEWDPAKTAVIISDMWDDHYCKRAAARVDEMAPRMNDVLAEARRRGALVIHAPSGTMDHYKDTPQRKRALEAPEVATKAPLKRWCHHDPQHEAPMPVDTSQPCDDPKPGKAVRVYHHQNDALDIEPPDAIADGFEAFYLMEQRGIENVIIMGVHTNMCVLGRPFGIRQLVYQGKNVVLMRDMTDAMYRPSCPPGVSHVRGTELVIEHIEKYWCPTCTSTDLLGRPAFRFQEDTRPHVAVIVSDDHYHADKTLPEFAQMLREDYGCYCTVLHGQGKADIPGTEELEKADVLVLYVRRLGLPKKQLGRIRAYLDAGKPLVALRTASHAFAVKYKEPKGYQPAEGTDEWRAFDPEVLGGNYHNHGPNAAGSDIAIVPEQKDHPILRGVEPARWHSVGSLYYLGPIKDDATLLMTASSGDRTEPLTWIRKYHGGRIFFTGLGHPEDFKEPPFRRLLINAIFWAMDQPVPEPRQNKE